MLWFLLLSLDAEEVDRWVLASTTWFLSVFVPMASYTAQQEGDAWGPFIVLRKWCAVGPV